VYLSTVIARIALAFVFGIAGTSKLLAGVTASRKTLAEFGLPRWLNTPVSFGLPLTELLAAVLLVATHSGWSGSILALTLLLIFDVALVTNLVLGRNPSCNCFGQLHSRPIGWPTLARNCVISVVAAWLVWQLPQNRDATLWGAISSFSSGEIAGIIVASIGFALIAILGFLLLHVLKQHGRLLLRIEALEKAKPGTLAAPAQPTALHGISVGAKALEFQLEDVNGTMIGLDRLLSQGKAALLVFTDPKCGPCQALMPEVARWQKDYVTDLNVALISTGLVAANLSKATEFGLTNVLVEKKRAVAEGYRAFGTPSAVVIRSDGTIGSFVASGADAIRQLIDHKAWSASGYGALLKALGHQPPAPAPIPTPALGTAAPTFALPDLEKRAVHSSSFKGHATVLLFWNPQCGFCQKMLPQLKAWEESEFAGAPRLVLASSGTREANAAMGLESTILLDDKFSVGSLYGCRGTPSAVRIDSRGQIASAFAVGEPGVMGLLFDSPKDAIENDLAPLRANAR
jgi:thiol-disulfide isomerase/thioredoxin